MKYIYCSSCFETRYRYTTAIASTGRKPRSPFGFSFFLLLLYLGTVDATAEMMISGGIALSEGARSGAFVLGRFLATKDLPRAKL